MSNSIVEIAQDGRHISLFRGFLKISEGEVELARVPLDAISALLLNCHQATLSQNILLACSDEGIPVILCGSNHQPAGILWPVVSHYKQAGNLQAQLQSSRPLAKQLWKQLVQSKISGQHQVLQATGKFSGNALAEMAGRVKSGDPENIEAQAARRYWPLLMGEEFTRNTESGGANSLLNYGYAVLRATVARAIIAVGLHPSLGVHHQNRLNAFCLVDDVMEAYRPAVDFMVYNFLQAGNLEVTKETKKDLAGLMEKPIAMPQETTSISNAILATTQSLVDSFANETASLYLPKSIITLNNLQIIDE